MRLALVIALITCGLMVLQFPTLFFFSTLRLLFDALKQKNHAFILPYKTCMVAL